MEFSEWLLPYSQYVITNAKIDLRKRRGPGTAQQKASIRADPPMHQSSKDQKAISSRQLHGTNSGQASSPNAGWEGIKERFTGLYMQSALTLRQIMVQMQQEFNFVATEQMYKKRISLWGLSRNMTADEKDRIIDLFNSVGSREQDLGHRLDKIMRHARHRAKVGTLDKNKLHKVVKHSRSPHLRRETQNKLIVRRRQHKHDSCKPSPDRIIRLSDEVEDTDLILRALRSSAQSNPSGSFCEAASLSEGLVQELEKGRLAWKLNAFTVARGHFATAGAMLLEDLPAGRIPALFLLRLLIPKIDRPQCRALQVFVHFATASMRRVLGETHPFALASTLIERLPGNSDIQVILCDYIADDLTVSDECYDQWFQIAEWRCSVLFRSGLQECAADRARTCIAKVREDGLWHDTMEEYAISARADYLYLRGRFQEAKMVYLYLLASIISSTGSLSEVYVNAHCVLAQICEIHELNFVQARLHYAEAWRLTEQTLGYEHNYTPRILQLYMLFLQRHGFRDILYQLEADEWRFMGELDVLTEGLWRVDDEDIVLHRQTAVTQCLTTLA